MEKVYARTKGIRDDMVSGFCPGCMHSTVIKLIGEVLEEMHLLDKAACAVGVGCCGLHMDYITYDYFLAAHGRACAVATGAKRSNPESLVFTYQGDGDLASIGLAETISAANRGENFTVIFVNNGIYGMTGGQMAPTTLPHQKTATSPKGKDPAKYGTLNVVDVLGKMDIAYLARGELVGPAGMNNCKKLIRKAFEHQLNGDGFSLVELLSPCPTNLNMPPVKAREHVHTEMTKYFPIGEYIDKKGGNQA